MKLQITKQQISAAETLMVAMAWLETVKPIVEKYQRDILIDREYYNDGELERIAKINEKRGLNIEVARERIYDPKLSYNLNEADFTQYLADCEAARKAAGLKIQRPGDCPLLVADNLFCTARRNFIEATTPIHGIRYDQLFSSTEWEKHMVNLTDLTLTLVAPYCKKVAADIFKN